MKIILESFSPSSRDWSDGYFEWLSTSFLGHVLISEYNISATFNVADLSPFLADTDLRTNPFEEEEDGIRASQRQRACTLFKQLKTEKEAGRTTRCSSKNLH